jgi:hypothetical protein
MFSGTSPDVITPSILRKMTGSSVRCCTLIYSVYGHAVSLV